MALSVSPSFPSPDRVQDNLSSRPTPDTNAVREQIEANAVRVDTTQPVIAPIGARVPVSQMPASQVIEPVTHAPLPANAVQVPEPVSVSPVAPSTALDPVLEGILGIIKSGQPVATPAPSGTGGRVYQTSAGTTPSGDTGGGINPVFIIGIVILGAGAYWYFFMRKGKGIKDD